MTISKIFTSTGSSDVLSLRKDESLLLEISGSFDAVLILEYTHNGGQTWIEQERFTSTVSRVIKAPDSANEKSLHRITCLDFTSGMAVTSIADVVDDVVGEFIKDNKGVTVLKAVDGGLVVKDMLVEGLTSTVGGKRLGVTSVTDPTYQIVKSDTLVFTDTSSNDITLTLPEIEDSVEDDGRVFRVQKVVNGNNTLTIEAQGSSTINGESTDIVSGIKNDNVSFMAWKGNWFLVNRDSFAFGAIQLENPGATQNLTSTPTKLAVFDMDAFSTPGVLTAKSATDVVTLDHVESLAQGGDGFKISFRIEVSTYQNNAELEVQVYIDGTAADIHDVRTKGSQFNAVLEAQGAVRIPAGSVDIELRVAGSVAAQATFASAIMIIERIGK